LEQGAAGEVTGERKPAVGRGNIGTGERLMIDLTMASINGIYQRNNILFAVDGGKKLVFQSILYGKRNHRSLLKNGRYKASLPFGVMLVGTLAGTQGSGYSRRF